MKLSSAPSAPWQPGDPDPRDLVLVGGGHTHVQVLRHLGMAPLPDDVRVTVVLDRPVAIYSGMVPGLVAGQYRRHELEIDVVPLARRAGARIVLAAATGVDPHRRLVRLSGRPPLRYDVASFDVGSTVAGLDVPGVRQHALPTRPIVALVDRVDDLVESVPAEGPFRIVVVGGGAGGVELAFGIQARLRGAVSDLEVRLLTDGERVLEGYGERVAATVAAAAAERDIEIETGAEVREVRADRVLLADGGERPADAVLWVTGATAHDLFEGSGLPLDERGFVWIRDTLQVEGHDDLFAVGDCASLRSGPTPKAGVYAVRQGPVLIINLSAWIHGTKLRRYRPQSDFLTLLNLGDGTAIGTKWGRTARGVLPMLVKDWIDRRFMERFQVLEPSGEPTPAFAEEMAPDEAMVCGGCAAKLAEPPLLGALQRLPDAPAAADGVEVLAGADPPDDAALVRLAGNRPGNGLRVAATIDGFRAFTDDAWLLGAVAAQNALSDLWAKGVAPTTAQAFVCLPHTASPGRSAALLFQLLSGARHTLDAAGVALLGGHTTSGLELLVGFSVAGVLDTGGDGFPLPLDGAQPGQSLVLTKPLGTGVLLHADMAGRAAGPWLERVLDQMLEGNRLAGLAAVELGATAATDVTGFGLAGHLGQMARGSGVGVELDLSAVPTLPGALELLLQGVRSTAHRQNRDAAVGIRAETLVDDDPRLEVLFDPQTSGGLLVALAPDPAAALVSRLREAGRVAAVVGRTLEASGGEGRGTIHCRV